MYYYGDVKVQEAPRRKLFRETEERSVSDPPLDGKRRRSRKERKGRGENRKIDGRFVEDEMGRET